jgi:hypothetical protein
MQWHGWQDRSDGPSSFVAKPLPHDDRFDDRRRIETEFFDETGIIRNPIDGGLGKWTDGPFNS